VPLYACIVGDNPARSEDLQKRYILARLREQAGDTTTALGTDRTLASAPGNNRGFVEKVIQPAIRRLAH
jgi:hypothetical protein